jgi:hypothetical protein
MAQIGQVPHRCVVMTTFRAPRWVANIKFLSPISSPYRGEGAGICYVEWFWVSGGVGSNGLSNLVLVLLADRGKWDALLLNSSSGRNASNLLCLRRICRLRQ